MVKINENLKKIISDNSFIKVMALTNKYKKDSPNKEVISLSIGDVTIPIPEKVVDVMLDTLNKQKYSDTFKGYGSSSGYDFLKKKILENEYGNLNFTLDEIYISNGTKIDCINILELFTNDAKILISNISYPIYLNGSLVLNKNIYTFPLKEEDNFIPQVPNNHYDIIFLCNPNNPIGNCYNYETLKKWVDYALKENAIIIYDNVYEDFIGGDLPHSIYEIENAKKVAIEFRSFSKSLSFSGIRCSYYILPNEIYPNVNELWKERTINRFNGVNYVTQVGAEAFYLDEVQDIIKGNIGYYLENAKLLRTGLLKNGFKIWGGENSPYIWVKIKENITSWQVFELYLTKLDVVVTPGIIFGNAGDKYFRVSALGKRKDIIKAIERITRYYEKNN